MKKIETEEKIIENLKKLKRDLIVLTNIDDETNYVTIVNNIIEILLENGNPNNGEYEEDLNPDDRKYIIDIFTNCFTLKEQNNFIKSHDMSSTEQKEILINNCLWVSALLSLKYIGYGIEYIDLVNQGYLGIENAIKRCTVNNNYCFSNVIKAEVIRYLEKYIREKGIYGYLGPKKYKALSSVNKVKENIQAPEDIADYLSYPEDEIKELIPLLEGPISLDTIKDVTFNGRNNAGIVNPEDIAISNISIEHIYEIIDSVLNEREKYIFYHLMGIKGYKKKRDLELASDLSVSYQRIGQLFKASKEKIQKQIRLEEYLAHKKRNNLSSISDFQKIKK